MQYQLMPDLQQEEYEALKADIAERGVMVPLEYDEQGNLLDGHHRLRACQELGVTSWPRMVRAGLSEDEKQEHVLALNLDRRHLDREQRRELVAKLRGGGWTTTKIAERLGAGIPAYLVLYTPADGGDIATLRVKRVAPYDSEEKRLTPAAWAKHLLLLRQQHHCPALAE